MNQETWQRVGKIAAEHHGDEIQFDGPDARSQVFALLVEVADVYVSMGEVERIRQALKVRRGHDVSLDALLETHEVSRLFMGTSELDTTLAAVRENLVGEYSDEPVARPVGPACNCGKPQIKAAARHDGTCPVWLAGSKGLTS
ncbi:MULTISPECIES: hypothetical protein [Streptomyces]|uniref:hypothetical protein n=1 Tax=Streptomyces TaxID=1883 RepID=UPI00364A135F